MACPSTWAAYLTSNEYGAYAVSFAIHLLVANLFQGALILPATVLGSTEYENQQDEYVATLVRLHGAMALGVGVVVAVAALLCLQFQLTDLGYCLLAASVATPLVLLLWLARAVWYIRLEPRAALLGAG